MKKIILILFTVIFVFISLAVYVANPFKGSSSIFGSKLTLDRNFKVTVEVMTPGGVREGSTVRNIRNTMPSMKWPERGNPARVKGEAVVIEMGKGQPPLFALIGNGSARAFYNAFPVPGGGPTTKEGLKFYRDLPIGAKGNVSLRHWPTFVTFTDMDDPKSVKQVINVSRCEREDVAQGICPEDQRDKFIITENKLEDYFGEGVSIKSVTVEITDEPVTQGVIDQFLPWLNNYYDKRLDGNRFGTTNSDYPIANQFSAGAFSTGESQ